MTTEDKGAKFKAWMLEVDKVLVHKCGLSSADLPDYCYRDDFDDGATARAAAAHALSAAKED